MATTLSIKQRLPSTMKHSNDARPSGFNQTEDSLITQLITTFMAVYARIDYRDPVHGPRVPRLSSDGKSYRYSFLLPKGAVVNRVYTFSYTATKKEDNGVFRTYVRSVHGDSENMYENIGVDNEFEGEIIGGSAPYYISVSSKIYTSNDFFPYIIDWSLNEERHKSCLCFFNVDQTQANMSDFVAKYLTFLAQNGLGNMKVKPAKVSYVNKHLKIEQLMMSEIPFEHPDMTPIYNLTSDKSMKHYKFSDLDYLMLPSIRVVGDSKVYAASMNDFNVLDTYVEYLAAIRAQFFKTLEEKEAYNAIHWKNGPTTTHLFGTDNRTFTINYKSGMESPNYDPEEYDSEKVLILIGSKKKRNSGRSNNSLNYDIFLRCVDPTFTRMIAGAVPFWHDNQHARSEKYSSYGYGCISKAFIQDIYAEGESFWKMLTQTEFKDSIFSSIVGYVSNEIDEMIFADARKLRSKVANDSSYADALIFHYNKTGEMNDNDQDSIRGAVAKVYRDVFTSYMKFLNEGVSFNRFSVYNTKSSDPENVENKAYMPFVRILQFPHRIAALTHGNTSQTKFGNEKHEDDSIKLSYTVSTTQHMNVNFYQVNGEANRVKTFSRADGGIFMATDNTSRTVRTNDAAVLRSPYSYPAYQAMKVSKLIGNHVEFFVPSVIIGGRKTGNQIGIQQANKTYTIQEVGHRYPEKLLGAQVDPKFYEQIRGAGHNYLPTSDNFSAVPPKYVYDTQQGSNRRRVEQTTYDENDIMNVREKWIEYVWSIEFIKNIFNRANVFSSIEDRDGNIMYDTTKQIEIACRIASSVDNNIFVLIESFEKEQTRDQFFMDESLFKVLQNLAEQTEYTEQWSRVEDELKTNPDATASERLRTIRNYVTDTTLSEFYARVFPQLHTNFVMNTDSRFRVTRLNKISTVLIDYMRNYKQNHKPKFSHQALINGYLLVVDFGGNMTDHTSYYAKEQYMALSASVYFSEQDEEPEKMKLSNIIDSLRKSHRYSSLARMISAIPVFANIADVPMFKHTDRTYIHLLNDMCSTNSVSMFYYLASLSNLDQENFRFGLINGFVKQVQVRNPQENTPQPLSTSETRDGRMFENIHRKIERDEETHTFKSFEQFISTVREKMNSVKNGKHRAGTEYVLDMAMYDRNVLRGIEPIDETRTSIADSSDRGEHPHEAFRTFYSRGGHKTKEELAERTSNLIKRYIDGDLYGV